MGRTRTSKSSSGSCSSRAEVRVGTCDADVDKDSIGEEGRLNNSDYAISKSDDEDDAIILNIANDYSSENDDTLADEREEERTLSAVRTRRTEQKNVSSAK